MLAYSDDIVCANRGLQQVCFPSRDLFDLHNRWLFSFNVTSSDRATIWHLKRSTCVQLHELNLWRVSLLEHACLYNKHLLLHRNVHLLVPIQRRSCCNRLQT